MKKDIFSEDNLANPSFTYFSFKSVGDKVSGVLKNNPNLNEMAQYGPQMEFLLTQEDGSHIMVTVGTTKSSTLDSIKDALSGDTLGFEFAENVDSKKFPGKKAKIIKSYWQQTDENKLLVASRPAEVEPEDTVPFV